MDTELLQAVNDLNRGDGALEEDILALVWIRQQIQLHQDMEQLLIDHQIKASWPDDQREPSFTKVK